VVIFAFIVNSAIGLCKLLAKHVPATTKTERGADLFSDCFILNCESEIQCYYS
jgi:hypothetical protein